MKKKQKAGKGIDTLKLVEDSESMDIVPIYLSIKNAAILLDLTEKALRCRINRGEIPQGIVMRMGPGTIRLHRLRYLDWLDSLMPGIAS